MATDMPANPIVCARSLIASRGRTTGGIRRFRPTVETSVTGITARRVVKGDATGWHFDTEQAIQECFQELQATSVDSQL